MSNICLTYAWGKNESTAAIAAAQDSSRTGNATTGSAAPAPEEPTGQ